jgi:hypothetical protein
MHRDFDGASLPNGERPWRLDPRSQSRHRRSRASGATFAWDLISDRGQAIATGLYIWTVEDRSGGGMQRGKLLVVKSDREP